MRNLIQSVPAAEAAYLAGDDQGAVDALNDPTIKILKTGDERRPGYVSNATMGRDLGQAGVAGFLAALAGAVAYNKGLGTPAGSATALLLDSFVARFNTTPDGIDFSNEEIRETLVPILAVAEIPAEPFLALGYTLISPATQEFNVNATLDDVAAARETDAAEAFEAEFDAAWNVLVSQAKTIGDRSATVAGLRLLADELEA